MLPLIPMQINKLGRQIAADPTDDSSPWLRFEADLKTGLAGLLGSLEFIAVDSCFDALRGSSDVRNEFREKFQAAQRTFDDALAGILEREPSSRSGEKASVWSDELDIWSVLPLDTVVVASYSNPTFSIPWLPAAPAWYDVSLSTTPGRASIPYIPAVWNSPNNVMSRIDQWLDALAGSVP